MKITAYEIWEVVVPTIPGTVHSPEWGPVGWDQVSKHIIRLHTDSGLSGIGETDRGVPRAAVEAAAARLMGVEPIRLSLQSLPLTEPAPAIRYADRAWESRTIPTNPAYDAFEMALFDLVGKYWGVPVHSLLGGALRTRVPADYWIGMQNATDAARNARIGRERGFQGLKMKCAIDDPWEQRLEAMIEAVGPGFKLTIDPNERFYRPWEFLNLARRLERFPNIALYEDPLPKWNLDWYKQVRGAVAAPIALHLSAPTDIVNALKAEACDCLNLGGGLVQFVRNAALAEAAGMACWHGSGNDLGIAEHAYLHAAAAARSCTLPSDFVGSWTREDDLIVEPIQFEQGQAIVPDRPGLGCEIDLVAIKKYRVR